jgi:hypothetical protein
LEGCGYGLIEAYQHLLGGTEQNHNKNFVKVADVMAEVRTENLMDMGIERYSYGNPVDTVDRHSTKLFCVRQRVVPLQV